jgi:hypothetical protein
MKVLGRIEGVGRVLEVFRGFGSVGETLKACRVPMEAWEDF